MNLGEVLGWEGHYDCLPRCPRNQGLEGHRHVLFLTAQSWNCHLVVCAVAHYQGRLKLVTKTSWALGVLVCLIEKGPGDAFFRLLRLSGTQRAFFGQYHCDYYSAALNTVPRTPR
jgi:hypothetical protein